MDVFTLLIVPMTCISLIYLWMRGELSKLGKEFPLLNSRFDIYAEFQYRISHDTKLIKKYHHTNQGY